MPDFTSTYIAPAIALILSLGFPWAILFSRYAVKRSRQTTLINLRETLQRGAGADVTILPAFEFALQKYDLDTVKTRSSLLEVTFYLLTTFLFGVITFSGMYMLITANATVDDPTQIRLALVGLRAAGVQVEEYGSLGKYEFSATTVICFAFLGSYLWSLFYLTRRVTNYDLTPMSFLRASQQIVFGCIMALVFYHFIENGHDTSNWANGPLIVGAFFLGFFPGAGFDYISRKLPQFRMKRIDADASAASRSIPVDMIDGIDSLIAFRLAEREITEVQNLAAENPILLCAETPYTLLACIDWIAQAQLILEVGPKAYRQLREIGVRTIFTLEQAQGVPYLEARILNILYNTEKTQAPRLEYRVAGMKANLHVARLYNVWTFTHHLSENLEKGGGVCTTSSVVNLRVPSSCRW